MINHRIELLRFLLIIIKNCELHAFSMSNAIFFLRNIISELFHLVLIRNQLLSLNMACDYLKVFGNMWKIEKRVLLRKL